MENSIIIEGVNCHSMVPVTLSVRRGVIEAIGESDPFRKSSVDDGDLIHRSSAGQAVFVAPGFIDNQVNGFAGIDFGSPSLTPADAARVARALLGTGVTTFLPALITASHKDIIRSLSVLSSAIEEDRIFRAMVPGFHIEGPYISALDGYRGCHPVEHARKPEWDEFSEYVEASGNRIMQVTLAPELEGALDFITRCTREGILVAIGHTAASAELVNEAVACGARISTHLGNGCANLIHRHNNPLWPQLANEYLTATIIADGHHLLPEEIVVFCRAKGYENIMLTSDVIHLAGMDPGTYSFLGSEVLLTDDGMLLDPLKQCLAGASFPLRRGVENILQYTGCTLGEASLMSSANAARILRLPGRGRLESGCRADIIRFSYVNNSINILNTWLEGEEVSSNFTKV
ncbi:MAG: amidohydrolase family protein [Bacteroidales bacterium]|nr:amidohydrolase family protein [Bacteroidales bacterium]